MIVCLVDEGWLLGVVIGKVWCGLDIVFEYYDLYKYFQIFQIVNGGLGKLYLCMVLDVMGEIGMDLCQVVMIGDMLFDMQMGCNVGVYILGVSWGFYMEKEILVGGVYEIYYIFDLFNIVFD